MDGIQMSEQTNGAVPGAGTLPVNTDCPIEAKAEESVGNDPRFAWDVSILTVPLDTLKRVTRERKYVIESIQNSVALLNRRDEKNEDVKGAVERVLAKVRELRARLTEIGMEEKKYLDQCRSRVGYLLRMKSPQAVKGMSYVEWNAGERIQLLVQEYIARCGYEKSLQCMLQRKSMREAAMLLDVDGFKEMQDLAVSLERGCWCSVALAWCKDHQAKLKKLKSSLPFQLHVQEFLQVLFKHSDTCSWKERQRNAIEYAKTYLAPYASANLSEFQQAAAALVLASPHLGGGKNATHFSPQDRWAGLVQQMRHEFFRLHGLPLTSPLEIHLEAGISALKTPLGMHSSKCSRDGDPMRSPALCRIAEALPYSKRTVSKLVCPVTGKIMEGSNAPMVLPNGYVYGEEAITTGLMCLDPHLNDVESILQDDEYPIRCPITEEVFSSMDARRAYIV